MADLVVQMRSLRARDRQNGVYDPLTLWKKLPGKNDRGEDTISVAGRLRDSRLARPSSNRNVNRFGQRSCLTPPHTWNRAVTEAVRSKCHSWSASVRLS